MIFKSVKAVISSEVVKPYSNKPSEGIITFNFEFSQLINSNFEYGK